MGARRVLISLLSHFCPTYRGNLRAPAVENRWLAITRSPGTHQQARGRRLSRRCRGVRELPAPSAHHASSSVRQAR